MNSIRRLLILASILALPVVVAAAGIGHRENRSGHSADQARRSAMSTNLDFHEAIYTFRFMDWRSSRDWPSGTWVAFIGADDDCNGHGRLGACSKTRSTR